MFGWLFGKKEKKEENKKIDKLYGYVIRSKFKDICSTLHSNSIFLADVIYISPTYEELSKMVFSFSSNYDYVHTAYTINNESGLFDCDDFALLLHVYVITERYKEFTSGGLSKEKLFPWAFGQIWYIDGKMGSHAKNVCITSDKGIVLIEPQTKKIELIKKGIKINFLRF